MPDLSIIRVGDAYYMVSTTMYFCPVAPIMKSKGMNATETRQAKVEFAGSRIYLKVKCLFRTDTSTEERAAFSYSLDGINWQCIGTDLSMRWTMTHFTGARFGLFIYAVKTAGGYVDFDYFRVKL